MEKTGTRIGFIGAGFIATRHLENLLGFDDVRVVALADPRLDQARDLAARCGASAYDDYNKMLDQEKLDCLYVCVPPFAHGAPERTALARDLPFFVEKPLAIDLPTAEAIAASVAKRGLITAVGYHWRYLEGTERARTLLRETSVRLALGYWLDLTPPPAWWIKEAGSGGQMVEQTTHIFDLARHLLGDVTRVYAVASRSERATYPGADIYDVSAVTLTFASGAIGQLASTCLLNWPHRIGLHLFGDGLAIELTEWDIMIDVGRGRHPETARGEPFIREDRDFIDAVQGKENRIRAPYGEALATHRVVMAAVRSVREGRAIDVAATVD